MCYWHLFEISEYRDVKQTPYVIILMEGGNEHDLTGAGNVKVITIQRILQPVIPKEYNFFSDRGSFPCLNYGALILVPPAKGMR
jgi:hypothetical protein